jgi:pimeloyl-ACP methyl ester carboxylesterase
MTFFQGSDPARPFLGPIAPLAALLLFGALACAQPRGARPEPDRALSSVPLPPSTDTEPSAQWPDKTYYRYADVRGQRIFYREAGSADHPALLLLPGFPASSHTYRELIPLLSGRYHVLAPDYLGSGFSDHPSPSSTRYTFDLLAEYVTGFVEARGLSEYVMYMQDFGAPVGYRVALAHPERLRGLVVQNANAYLEGLTEARRDFFRRAHEGGETSRALRARVVSADSIRDQQYLRDVPGDKRARMSPDSWTTDLAFLATDADREIQMQLFQDYQTNIDAYPRWQAFLRERQPPTLIVWGANDPAFISAGAEAYRRDLPNAELHLLDAGHFAVEEQAVAIAQYITRFMTRLPGR